MTLGGLMKEFRTVHFKERPSRASAGKMLSMFREGGSFRGAVHAYSEGGDREAWLLLDGGVPVAAVAKRGEDVLVGEDAVELARGLDGISFARLVGGSFESLRQEAQGTPAATAPR